MDVFEKFYKKNMETSVDCPLCNAGTSTEAYRFSIEDRMNTIYHCKHCDFLFCRPMPLTELCQQQMDTIDDAELYNSSLLKSVYEKLIIGKEIRSVKKILGQGKHTLLDIGCGTGWTTNIWKLNGFDVTGLEPSESRRKIAQEKYGLRVLPNYIEELDSGHSYDVIVLRHVLEHLENPVAMVSKIRSLLNKNGLFILIVPNINCLGRYIFETKWSWVLPFHCNFFTPQSIKVLATMAEFDMCNLYQTPSPLWYPESFLRVLPEKGTSIIRRIYEKVNIFSMLPFAPLVGVSKLLGLSDNLTLVGRAKD